MNSNGTVRNETAVRAQQLNQVYTTVRTPLEALVVERAANSLLSHTLSRRSLATTRTRTLIWRTTTSRSIRLSRIGPKSMARRRSTSSSSLLMGTAARPLAAATGPIVDANREREQLPPVANHQRTRCRVPLQRYRKGPPAVRRRQEPQQRQHLEHVWRRAPLLSGTPRQWARPPRGRVV